MKNKITDLRNHLFTCIEGLLDDEQPMDIERARAVADVAGVIIESAKAEIQFYKVTGQTQGTDFILEPPKVLK